MTSQRRDTGGELVGKCQQALAEKGGRPGQRRSAAQGSSGRQEAREVPKLQAAHARDGKSGPRPFGRVADCRAEAPSGATGFRH